MADTSSSLLHLRSLTTNYNSPLFLPPKQYFSSALHSRNLRFSRIRRRSPHLLLLLKPSPFAASASEIVVISTHELSDGSLLFRFGDPSEIRQNVEMEESEILKEEIEEEDTNGSTMVIDESDVTASSSTEAGDSAESIVGSGNAIIAVEAERLFSAKSLTATVDIEMPVSISNNKMGVLSSPDLEIELIENAEGLKEEDKDFTFNEEIGDVSSPGLEIKQIENVEGDFTSNSEMEGASSRDLETKLIQNVDGRNEEDKDFTSNRETEGEVKQIENVEGDFTSISEMEGGSSLDLETKLIENVDGRNEEDKDFTSNRETEGELKQIENVEGDFTSNSEMEGGSSLDLETKLIENVDGRNEEDKDFTSNRETEGEVNQIENVEGGFTTNKEIGGVSSPDLDIKLIENVDVGPNEDKDVTSDEEMRGVSGLDLEIKQVGNIDGLNEEDNNVTLDEEMGGVSSLALDIKQIENVEGLNEEDTDLTSNKEIVSVSNPDLEIKQIENVEDLNDEGKDLSAVEASIPDGSSLIENIAVEVSYDESLEETSNVTCTINETESTSILDDVVEERPKKDVDSPVDVSILDPSSEVVDDVTTVASLEKESDDISPADIDADRTGKLGESLNEVCEDSLVNGSILNKSSEVENGKKTDGNSSASDIEIELTGTVEEGSSQEYEHSPVDKRFEILNNPTAALPENEAAEVTSLPYEDSLADASEVEYGISEVVLLEKETDGNTSASDVVIETTGNVEEIKNEEYENFPMDKKSEVLNNTTAALPEKEPADITSAPFVDSLVDASVLNEIPEVENGISAVVLVDEETERNTSTSDLELEPTQNVEEGINEDCEESRVDTIEALSKKETAEITSAPFEDSLVYASVLSENPEVENGISAVVLVDEETERNTSISDLEIEPTENVKEGIIEDCVESRVDTIEALPKKETADITATDFDVEHTGDGEQVVDEILEEPNSVENCITPQEVSEKETSVAIASVALKMDPISALGTDAAIITNVVPVNELQNAEINNEKVGDDSESFDGNMVSSSSDSEPYLSLNKETDIPNLQAETNSLAIEASTETDVDNIETEALEMQNVLSIGNESDTYGGEEGSPTTELAMTWSIGSEEQASGYGSGIQNETVGYVSEKDPTQLLTVSPQSEAGSMLGEEIGTKTEEESKEDDDSENQTVGADIAEASVHKTTAPEFAEYTISSQEILTTDFILSSGAALFPHPSKVLTGGEDAYFVANQTWLGIADGVSQWSLEGTIPGVYAKELMKNCEKLVADCSGNSINTPLELLNLSVAETQSPGSSTVLIAKFDGQALHVANIGDSGFIVLRHGAVYKRSSPMHHAFSLPLLIKRGDDCSSLAKLYRVDLEEEDVIVIATNGLLDNLYDQEILLITMKSLAHGKSPEEIAEVLAKKAQDAGMSASGRSPFADEAQAAGFPGFSGGKLDDVAVIVSLVQKQHG